MVHFMPDNQRERYNKVIFRLLIMWRLKQDIISSPYLTVGG